MKGREYILVITRDITEQMKSEEVRNRLTRELRALSSCNEVLIRAENEEVLLNEICHIICDIAGYRSAWVGFIINGQTPSIKVVATAGFTESFTSNKIYPLRDNDKSPIDDVIQNKKSIVTTDLVNEFSGSHLWSDYVLKDGCRSVISLPLLDGTNIIGVLCICSSESNIFAVEEIKLLEELSGDLSFGIMTLRTRVERGLTQKALVYEKELSDALIEASPGIFCVLDQNNRFLRINTNSMKLKGLSRKNSAWHDPLDLIFKEDYQKAKQHLDQLPHVGYIQDDIRFEFKPGEISWWSMSGHAVGIAGATYLIISGFEITSRKQMEDNLQRALKEKDVLLQELYHRTKNNMQVISSYLAMQALNLDDEHLQSIFSEMENRIRAMALVHEKLYKSKDLTNINLRNYLIDLTNLIFNSFHSTSDKVTLTFEIESVSVTMDVAIPIGLVVTELLTNSLKYAFPDGRTGNILIRVQKLDHGELELDINDNGVGVPNGIDFTHKSSIGIPTVLSIVRKQLRGSVVFDTSAGFNSKVILQSDLYSQRV
jgi:PAS domain S-box-containing protein